jgi:hypothetical protein
MGSLFWLNQMGSWALVAIVIIGFLIAILFLRLLWNSTFPDLFEFKAVFENPIASNAAFWWRILFGKFD